MGALSQDLGPTDLGSTDSGPADLGPPDLGSPDLGPPDMGGLGPVNVDVENPARLLSEYAFFSWQSGQFEYNEGVVPYELNAPLFSDFALKARAIWLPPGTSITYRAPEAFEFPQGSAIIKSFLIAPDLREPERDVRIIETRVLLKTADGWEPYPYRWREDQSDAELFVRGEVQTLDFVDPAGQARTAQYLIPQRNQCLECHELKDEMDESFTTVIGPKARHLHRMNVYDGQSKNQLQHMEDVGYLTGLPPLDEVEAAFDFEALAQTGTAALDAVGLDRAARDYLDINCAHCHNPRGVQGVTSQLFLNFDNEDLFRLGVCKEPGSAGGGAGGLQYDIVPGDADASILWFRTQTETVGEMMPLIGRSLADDLGVAVVRAWIEGMDPVVCGE